MADWCYGEAEGGNGSSRWPTVWRVVTLRTWGRVGDRWWRYCGVVVELG